MKNKNIKTMAKQVTKASVNAGGVVGENTIWDGPLSQLGRPHGKGSSSGIKGMKLKLADCGCDSLKGPITQRAKG